MYICFFPKRKFSLFQKMVWRRQVSKHLLKTTLIHAKMHEGNSWKKKKTLYMISLKTTQWLTIKQNWIFEKYCTELYVFHINILNKLKCRNNYLPIRRKWWKLDYSVLCPFVIMMMIYEIKYILLTSLNFAMMKSRHIYNVNNKQCYVKLLDTYCRENYRIHQLFSVDYEHIWTK